MVSGSRLHPCYLAILSRHRISSSQVSYETNPMIHLEYVVSLRCPNRKKVRVVMVAIGG